MRRTGVIEHTTVPADRHWSDPLRDERLADEARALAKLHNLGNELQRTIERDPRQWDRRPDVIIFRYCNGRVILCDDKWSVETAQ